MDCKNTSLITKTLAGHEFDTSNIIELHLQRISDEITCSLFALGYRDDAIIGTASWVVAAWRVLGVRSWYSETLDFVIKMFFCGNKELTDEDKESAFFLSVFSACLFCVDRALIHARRNHTHKAEMWIDAAQNLRFSILKSPFSYQKSIAKSGGEAKDIKHGHFAKREQIRAIWASGKYSSRDICAEQECASLDMSFSTARKALRGTPDPA